MNKDFANESPKKDILFYLALIFLLLFSLMGFGIDCDEFMQKTDIKIPGGYFYMVFLVDFLMVVGLTLIYFYKKAGIFLFPLAVLTHFFMHNFFLSTFLYTDVTNLFVFTTLGLLAFIPKWQFFK
ncbi:hypothetical protein [Chryseobacterium sp.]|uniref:hypothetical protein n=1 Tax=Chryseobacterium sp. TaxID=1871047 RepID=UPI0011CC1F74|nr:hypothetical protein [Chryseobacterium sp.]TXF75081.1 hypothetical protein FUA25_12465 [Chryseobacterium sp.]